jgi:hypothetical protein
MLRDVKTAKNKNEFIAYCRQEIFPLDARKVELQESFMQVVKDNKEEPTRPAESFTTTRDEIDGRTTVPCGSYCAIPNADKKSTVEGDGHQGYLLVVWALSRDLGISRANIEVAITKLGKVLEKRIGVEYID